MATVTRAKKETAPASRSPRTTKKAQAAEEAIQQAPASPIHKASVEQIQERAYMLWLQRGGAHGGALNDWISAERELTQES